MKLERYHSSVILTPDEGEALTFLFSSNNYAEAALALANIAFKYGKIEGTSESKKIMEGRR